MSGLTAGDGLDEPVGPADEISRIERCQVCGDTTLEEFYRVENVPVQTTVLLDSEESAGAFPTGHVVLEICRVCGFIQNSFFDRELIDYSLPTEESQAFSPLFSKYADALADRLISEHSLKGRDVLEIGSGKGEFLLSLAARGIRRGVGIDPGFLPDRVPTPASHVEFIRKFYGAGDVELTGDLVVARHLLEHVSNVREFLAWLAESASQTPDSSIFIEVPETGRILGEGAFWDVYYEHCSYFTTSSIERALRESGLVPDKTELGFDGQYILSFSTPHAEDANWTRENRTDTDNLVGAAESFGLATTESRERWHDRIENELARRGGVVLWGASSKTVSFLSSIDVGEVTVVDINPHKQGQWLPGVSVLVESPDVLEARVPSMVIPMNPIYRDEIQNDLEAMGLEPKLIAVG